MNTATPVNLSTKIQNKRRRTQKAHKSIDHSRKHGGDKQQPMLMEMYMDPAELQAKRSQVKLKKKKLRVKR